MPGLANEQLDWKMNPCVDCGDENPRMWFNLDGLGRKYWGVCLSDECSLNEIQQPSTACNTQDDAITLWNELNPIPCSSDAA